MPKVIDLFCGCGGMSAGFENAGFEIVSAYDKWQPAIDTYNANFSHTAKMVDLYSESILAEIESIGPDLIVGGPPCQDFSIAGNRTHKSKRANLTLKFAEIVCKSGVATFVMENVYNIQRFPVLDQALEIYKSFGYGLTQGVFNASLMGVPQSRRRYFLIGKKNKKEEFLGEQLAAGLAKIPMTVRDALGDTLGTEYYYMHPRSYKRRAIFSIDEPSSTIRGVNRPIPPAYSPHPADKTADLAKVRALTSNERAALQTFPPSFEFRGSKTQVEQQIGNAVPVLMAEYIARAVMAEIREGS